MPVIPGRGLLRLLALWLGLALGTLAAPGLVPVWSGAGLALLVLVALALLEVARRPDLDVERTLPPSLPLGEWTDVPLRITRPGGAGRRLRLEIHDHHPPEVEQEGLPGMAAVPKDGGVQLTYALRPRRRGDLHFGRVEAWRRSTFDLVRRRIWLGSPATVRVLPNFRPILSQGLAGLEESLARLGVHMQRRRGEGLDFQQLRDYRDGDTMRQVDWKATARRGQLITRQYQDERDQQVLLLLDCGRRMHAREGDLTHFDHVLNASLLLTYAAVRQGDAVGLQTFAGDERWLSPVRGGSALPRFLDAVYDLETTLESPDFPDAAARLMRRQRRRALVILVTNLRDEDTHELLPAIASLRRRHFVLVASTREQDLGRMREQEVSSHRAAVEVGAAHVYLEDRRRAHEAIRAAGAVVLDVEPQELPHSLVARYLDIKRAGQL